MKSNESKCSFTLAWFKVSLGTAMGAVLEGEDKSCKVLTTGPGNLPLLLVKLPWEGASRLSL